ncbi:MAG TPA: alpha-L-arabinofuranosidase C, partial [Cellvibrionaceae bacterium]|nr:alpha-L-arabinofuranosidase C [Cellvibrionaceae bacterium]
MRLGAVETGRTLSLSQCDKILIENIAVPQVSAWGEFKTLAMGKITLKGGTQKIRLNITGADGVDIDWIYLGNYSGTIDPVTP